MKKTILLLFLIVSYYPNFAQNTFQIAYETTNFSSKKNIRIPLEDNQGNKVELPISIIRGAKSGPVFTILAGVHGYEYPPIISTQAILQEINPEELIGTLVIIPIANKGSFFDEHPTSIQWMTRISIKCFPETQQEALPNKLLILLQIILSVLQMFF